MAVWQDLVICGVTPGEGVNSAYVHECGFADLIHLIKNLITDLVLIATLLAVVAFCYAGFLLLTSNGNKSALDKAKDILGKVVTGYVVILSAWLIIYTITNVLLSSGYTLLGTPVVQ